MNSIEIKRKIVQSGGSKIYKDWQELVPSLTQDDFVEALEWVCEDAGENGNGTGKLTREIGLTPTGIVRIKRVNGLTTTMYRLDNGKLWSGATFNVPCTEKFVKDAEKAIENGYADADGNIKLNYKLSLSAADRV